MLTILCYSAVVQRRFVPRHLMKDTEYVVAIETKYCSHREPTWSSGD
jgi:hypothetical protein